VLNASAQSKAYLKQFVLFIEIVLGNEGSVEMLGYILYSLY